MLIRNNRIISESYLQKFEKDSILTIRVNDILNNEMEIEKLGFKQNDINGTTILPFVFNSYSRKNAEQFYKTDKSRTNEKSGAGLGLSFVRNILLLHKQSIWVESLDTKEGSNAKYTKFTFTLEKE